MSAVRRAARVLLTAAALGAFLAGCRADPEPGRHSQADRNAKPPRPASGLPGNASPAPAESTDPMSADVGRFMRGTDDTARIVYAAMVNDVAQIFSVQPDGQRSIQLTVDARYKCRPVWSLDHRRVAFFRFESDRPVGDFVDLMVMQANGSDVRLVKPHLKVDVQVTRPSWNPDGSVLYVQERDFSSMLFGYTLADGRQTDTVRLPRGTFLSQAHLLSPDFRWIAGAGVDPQSGLMHIGTVRRSDGRDMDLMKPFSKLPVHVGEVAWSYDSRYVAFEIDNLVVVMSSCYRPGFRVSPLTPPEMNAELSDPAFSPGGRYLACILQKNKEGVMGAGDREVRSDIWVMNADGTQGRQITDSGTCFDPHW